MSRILSASAWHFRQHYITDADLPAMVNGTGLSKADYLRTILLPDAKVTPGPSLRSGDFGEILIGDYTSSSLDIGARVSCATKIAGTEMTQPRVATSSASSSWPMARRIRATSCSSLNPSRA
jgi:hypothetical protein